MFPKDREAITKQSNIIYWFKCGRIEYDDEYFGESARLFEERYKEHLKASSPIFEHQNITGHTTVENFKNCREGGSKYGQGHNRSNIHQSITLPSIETLASTTCHTSWTKFCFPFQN